MRDAIPGGEVPACVSRAPRSFRSAVTRRPVTSRPRNSASTWRRSSTSSCEKTARKSREASARRSETRPVRSPARLLRCGDVIRRRDGARPVVASRQKRRLHRVWFASCGRPKVRRRSGRFNDVTTARRRFRSFVTLLFRNASESRRCSVRKGRKTLVEKFGPLPTTFL